MFHSDHKQLDLNDVWKEERPQDTQDHVGGFFYGNPELHPQEKVNDVHVPSSD